MKTTKTLHDINTFASSDDNETHLVGRDEQGNEFHVIFNTFELLEWLDIDYMKDKVKSYIDSK